LPHNTVSAIAQTLDGFMWIGTHEGLVRFDGSKFTSFPAKQTAGLESDHVDCLSADRDGNLWIGLERGGVSRWREDGFETLSAVAAYTNRINSLTPQRNELWVGLTHGRLLRLREGVWTAMAGAGDFSAQGRVFCVAEAGDRTWFASDTSLGYVEAGRCVTLVSNRLEYFRIAPRLEGGVWLARGQKLEHLDRDLAITGVAGLQLSGDSGGIETLYPDSTGALWLGTRGNGLYRFADGALTRVPTSHDFILSVCEDSEGDIWAGTWGGGLNRLKRKLLHVHGTDDGLPKSLVLSLAEDDTDQLWVAARNAPPVSFDPDRTGVTHQTNGWTAGSASVVCADRSGGMWVATEQRGLFHWQDGHYRAVNFPRSFIISLFQDSRTNLWVGTLRDGLFQCAPGAEPRLRGADDLREITAITEDANGTLWVGTQKGTLHHRRRGQESFTALGLNDGLPGQKIQVIHADGADRLWIGTRGGGLVRLKNNTFQVLTTAQGIPDDDIRQILADDVGGLWIGGARGLFRCWSGDLDLALEDGKFAIECVSLGASHGLENFEFQEGFRNAMHRTRAGKLWFATTRGAVEVHPDRFTLQDEPPPVYIQAVTVDGRALPVRSGTGLEIPPAAGRVEIRYTATSFSAPENVRFRHRLEGFDADWVEAGPERSVTYYRLPPGEYRFRVLARGSTGIWNQVGDNVGLTVPPTLWETLWFRGLVLAVGALLIAVAVRLTLLRRMRRRLEELERATTLENERRRIARDMHDELGASLTTLALMSEQMRRQPHLDPGATTTVERIARTVTEVTHTLDQIVWTVNPGNDTLERLIGYLSRHAEEFLSSSPIRLTQELPTLITDHAINSDIRHQLFLSFKEALNNAVKHSRATELHLRIWLESQQLHVSIQDNGVGFNPAAVAGQGEGLSTLRDRLTHIGGATRLESAPGRGTKVTLTLPLGPARGAYSC
jgi:signal transduction histidine kinase/ligand-binding sensor domain-containing protein